MTKAEFVDRVAENSGLGKGEASKAVDAVLDSIQEVLARGGEINFTGFGKFSVADRSARQESTRRPARRSRSLRARCRASRQGRPQGAVKGG